MRRLSILAIAVFLFAPAWLAARGPWGPPDTITQVTGVIDAIDAVELQIVVGDVTVQVTPATVIRIGSEPADFDALAVGMTVKACGKLVDGVLVAHQITVMYGGK